MASPTSSSSKPQGGPSIQPVATAATSQAGNLLTKEEVSKKVKRIHDLLKGSTSLEECSSAFDACNQDVAKALNLLQNKVVERPVSRSPSVKPSSSSKPEVKFVEHSLVIQFYRGTCKVPRNPKDLVGYFKDLTPLTHVTVSINIKSSFDQLRVLLEKNAATSSRWNNVDRYTLQNSLLLCKVKKVVETSKNLPIHLGKGFFPLRSKEDWKAIVPALGTSSRNCLTVKFVRIDDGEDNLEGGEVDGAEEMEQSRGGDLGQSEEEPFQLDSGVDFGFFDEAPPSLQEESVSVGITGEPNIEKGNDERPYKKARFETPPHTEPSFPALSPIAADKQHEAALPAASSLPEEKEQEGDDGLKTSPFDLDLGVHMPEHHEPQPLAPITAPLCPILEDEKEEETLCNPDDERGQLVNSQEPPKLEEQPSKKLSRPDSAASIVEDDLFLAYAAEVEQSNSRYSPASPTGREELAPPVIEADQQSFLERDGSPSEGTSVILVDRKVEKSDPSQLYKSSPTVFLCTSVPESPSTIPLRYTTGGSISSDTGSALEGQYGDDLSFVSWKVSDTRLGPYLTVHRFGEDYHPGYESLTLKLFKANILDMEHLASCYRGAPHGKALLSKGLCLIEIAAVESWLELWVELGLIEGQNSVEAAVDIDWLKNQVKKGL